jgi:hypothetical protein
MYALSNVSVANRILSDPAKLWAVRAPSFTDRPADVAGTAAAISGAKTASDVLRSMGKGWRPRSDQKYMELEYSATIMGGIRALRAAGIWPWTGVITDQFPTLYFTKATGRENVLRQLTGLAAKGARYAGDHPPTSGFLAAEYIRKEVMDAKLGQAAWALRGLILVEEAYTNQQVRAKVEATAGKVASTVGPLITPIPVIGWILGPILTTGGKVSTYHSMAVQLEAERSKQEILIFQSMYEQGMARRVADAQMEVARQQLNSTMAQTASARDLALVSAAKRGKDLATAAMIGSGVLFVGAVGIGVGFIIKRLRHRRKR